MEEAGVLVGVELAGGGGGAPAELEVALELALEEPVVLELPLEPMQEEEPPWTVKGAEFWVAPVLSRRVRPREVPAVMLTVHVIEVAEV